MLVSKFVSCIRGNDVAELKGMLSFLPAVYPGANDWLENRLFDIYEGKAYCDVARLNGAIGGLLISTPKGPSRMKFSTIFVKPHCRNFGVGAELLSSAIDRGQRMGVESISVTVSESRQAAIGGFLELYSFTLGPIIPDLYRDGEAEVVYSLKI